MECVIKQGEPFQFQDSERDTIEKILKDFKINESGCIFPERNICILPEGKVGVFKLPSKTVIINPRNEGVELKHVLRMYHFVTQSVFFSSIYDPDFELDTNNYTIDLSKLFINELREIIRKGIPSNYLVMEENLNFIRGKIDLLKTQLNISRKINNPVSSCFDEITIENVLNYVLSGALWKIKDNIETPDFVFASNSLPFCTPEIASSLIGKVILNRKNAYCSKAFDLGKMILEDAFFVNAGTDVQGAAFLVDFNILFENFVWTVLRDYSRDSKYFRWTSPKIFGQIDVSANDNRGYLPDILYNYQEGIRPHSVGIIDAKNKTSRVFTNSDIYQIEFYAGLLNARKLILVYPSTQYKQLLKLKMIINGPPVKEIYAAFINIASEKGNEFAETINSFCNDIINCIHS
jgi:5-methylcytosine-specific restriction enzyme subunit McrC